MERVTGIGGIFFSAKDPTALAEWYRVHLGIDVKEWLGTTFFWQRPEHPEPHGSTTWSIQPEGSEMLANSKAPFMVNYRVPDLKRLLSVLREDGCEVEDQVEESEYGIFGWVRDPEGNRVELWQPPEGPLPD